MNRSRSTLVRLVVLAALVVAALGVGAAAGPRSAAALAPGATSFVAVDPARLADTRDGAGAMRLDAHTVRVTVAGRMGVPATAAAAVLVVTAAGSPGPGYVTVSPAGGTRPFTASLNTDRAGQVIGNLVTVPLGVGGAVDVFTQVPMDVVVDVVGAYTPAAGARSAGRFVARPGGAARALDTRERGHAVLGGVTEWVSFAALGLPADATAVVVDLTAVDAAPGFWTAFAGDRTRPLAASLNVDTAGQTRSTQAIIRVGPGQRGINVFAQSGGHLVVDLVGWFTGPGAAVSTDGLFIPAPPRRLVDTRDAQSLAPWAGTTAEFAAGAPADVPVGAVVLNVAVTSPWRAGFVTAHGAGTPRPWAANLNVDSFDQTVSNHAIVPVASRGVALFTQSGAHLIADTAGWFVGTPIPSTEPVVPWPRIGPAYIAAISAAGADIDVAVSFNPRINPTLNAGYAVPWAGSGVVGAEGHTLVLAHRTTHGAPFYHLDKMPVGSTFEVTGTDGRIYVYQVTRVDIVRPVPAEILELAEGSGPVTITLAACHPLGSIRFRLAVTGRLIAAV